MLIIELLQTSTTISNPLWFLSLSLVFALLPILVGLLTSFVKLSVVLGVIKNALGTQHAPSGMLTMALSLALTLVIMQPVLEQSRSIASKIEIDKLQQASSDEIIKNLLFLAGPWKTFLQNNSGRRELTVIAEAAAHKVKLDTDQAKDSLILLIPSFLLTELKEGFAMAFLLLLPFLVIDLIVANILMGLGMMMVSPVMITLPLKLILFVVSDAWLLLSRALIRSYGV